MLNRLTTTALAALIALGAATQAQAADLTLRFAHFWPAVSGAHRNVYQAWADRVEEASGGRIEVQVFPSATLAKPPAQYEAVKNGVADVTATVLGYTANRFPLSQVVELPGIVRDAAHGSCIVQGLYDEGLIADEFRDTRPLFLFTHGPGVIHTGDRAVETPKDLAGLRVRRPTAVVANILEEVQAQPVGMPAPESYPAMQRGVIDGVALPWEAMVSFRLNELARHHIEIGGLYSLAFVVTMNRAVYDGLPEDLKKVIDDNAGMAWARIAAANFDRMDRIGREEAVKAGHDIHTVEGGGSNPAWKPILDRATESYLSDLEARGLPARRVYARARELALSCAGPAG